MTPALYSYSSFCSGGSTFHRSPTRRAISVNERFWPLSSSRTSVQEIRINCEHHVCRWWLFRRVFIRLVYPSVYSVHGFIEVGRCRYSYPRMSTVLSLRLNYPFIVRPETPRRGIVVRFITGVLRKWLRAKPWNRFVFCQKKICLDKCQCYHHSPSGQVWAKVLNTIRQLRKRLIPFKFRSKAGNGRHETIGYKLLTRRCPSLNPIYALCRDNIVRELSRENISSQLRRSGQSRHEAAGG